MAAQPVRLQLSRRKGFDLQKLSRETNGLDAVSVARPTVFGNPFVHDDPAVAVQAYARLCRGGSNSFEMGPGALQFAPNAHPNGVHWAFPEFLRGQGLPALRGRNLACWCAQSPCHADVLLALAAGRPFCDGPFLQPPTGSGEPK